MTSEELRAKYQVLQRIGLEGSVATHLAVAPTRMVVMIHFLGCPDEESRLLIARLDRLMESDRARVLHVAQVDGSWVIITKFLSGAQTLREWLDRLPTTPDVFDVVRPNPDEALAETARSGESPVDAAAARSAGAPELRQDDSGDRAALHDNSGDRAALDDNRNDVPQDPGDFTRLFMAVKADGAPARDDRFEPTVRQQDDHAARPKATDTREEPGDFTRLFMATSTRATEPPSGPADREPPPLPEPRRANPPVEPGEFTRIFQGTERPMFQPLKQPDVFGERQLGIAPDESYLDKLDASPARQQRAPDVIDTFALPGSQKPLPGVPSGPPQAAGPSEYTRVIAGISAPAQYTPQPLPAAAAPPPVAPASSARPILIGIALIVVLAIAIVVFFALKTR